MISPDGNIKEFIKAIRGKSYEEVVLSADKEATEAERNYYRKKSETANLMVCENYQAYAKSLKDFIQFIRYSSKSSCCADKEAMKMASKTRIRLWNAARDHRALPGSIDSGR